MFTGLIESLATITAIEPGSGSVRLTLDPHTSVFETTLGDSVAINGVCLTIEEYRGGLPVFRAITETLQRSSLGSLQIGSKVNIERAMPAHGRLDGHIVQGHVDTVGILSTIEKSGDSFYYHFTVTTDHMKYIAEKGSIAIDGISLTVASVHASGFSVALIPHTIEHTTLQFKSSGDQVNLECDVLARYIEQLMKYREPKESSHEKDARLLALLERNNF